MIIEIFSMLLLGWVAFGAVGRSMESGEWEGFVMFGRGGDSFKPCGSRETWWIKVKGFSRALDELRAQYNEIAEHPYDPVYLRISGEVSKKGQFGPLGSYQRVVYVEEVLEVRTRQDNDCRKRRV
ncbi:MAG TPA: hypothetical protein PKH77_23030 [Anaerolineae bacterium]|nr:hypothetical protein [Anaerolineae bacterium]